MIVDLIPFFNQQGTSIVARVQQNLASTGTDATKETSRSLHYQVTVSGFTTTFEVLGKPFIMVVETGRKPTPQYTKPSKQFVASVKEWADTKGIGKFAYGIALSIHQHGSTLWQKGGRKDIISNVVNQNLTDQISKDILAQFADHYLKNAVKIVSNNN